MMYSGLVGEKKKTVSRPWGKMESYSKKWAPLHRTKKAREKRIITNRELRKRITIYIKRGQYELNEPRIYRKF